MLDKQPLPKLLHNIYSERMETILDVERQGVKKRLFFEKGVCVYSQSNQVSEVLGRVLVRHGLIPQEAYENTLELVLKERKGHGEVLISMGLITPGELDLALKTQIEERIWDIFGWPDGDYHYEKTPLPGDLPVRIPLHPGYLILHGIKRGYYPKERLNEEVSRILNKRFIKNPEQGLYRLDDLKPSPQELRTFSIIDGSKTLEEVIKGAGSSLEEARPFVSTLIITNLITQKEQGLETQERVLLEYLTGEGVRLRGLNYFDRLGISRSTDKAGIRKAYLNIARTFHPDRFNRNNPDIQKAIHDVFTLLNEAYQTLRDDEGRKVYEESIKAGKGVEGDKTSTAIIEGELQFHKGKMALHRRDYKMAIEAFEWAVKMNSNEGEYKAYLGWAVFNANPHDRERAMTLIREAVHLNPKEARAHYFLGVLYRVGGDIKMARQLFQKAIELNPYLVEAKSELRFLQARTGKEKKGFFKGLFKK